MNKKKAKKIIYGGMIGTLVATTVTSLYMYHSIRRLMNNFEIKFDAYEV